MRWRSCTLMWSLALYGRNLLSGEPALGGIHSIHWSRPCGCAIDLPEWPVMACESSVLASLFATKIIFTNAPWSFLVIANIFGSIKEVANEMCLKSRYKFSGSTCHGGKKSIPQTFYTPITTFAIVYHIIVLLDIGFPTHYYDWRFVHYSLLLLSVVFSKHGHAQSDALLLFYCFFSLSYFHFSFGDLPWSRGGIGSHFTPYWNVGVPCIPCSLFVAIEFKKYNFIVHAWGHVGVTMCVHTFAHFISRTP